MQLTLEQKRIQVLRAQFALQGINYDKATRRFLELHAREDTTPTLRLIPVVVDQLNQDLVSDSQEAG